MIRSVHTSGVMVPNLWEIYNNQYPLRILVFGAALTLLQTRSRLQEVGRTTIMTLLDQWVEQNRFLPIFHQSLTIFVSINAEMKNTTIVFYELRDYIYFIYQGKNSKYFKKGVFLLLILRRAKNSC